MTLRTNSLELRIPPLLVVAIVAAAMAGMDHAMPALRISIPAGTVLSLVCYVLGTGVAGAGVLAFHRHKTTVNPFTPERSSTLVVSGVYRLSRNPMYLGLLLALAGWGIQLANVAALLLVPLFVLYMNRFQIEPEERALMAMFGERFAKYSATARQWV